MARLWHSVDKLPLLSWRTILLIAAPFLVACLFRFWLTPMSRVPFEADEAIFLLIGRHILQGERPIFFYGEAYGAVSDSYLIALFYSFLNDTVLVGRLTQSLEYLLGMGFTFLLARRLLPAASFGPLAVLWLMALPPLLMTTWTIPVVEYAVVICLGSILSYLGYRLLQEDADRLWCWILFGAVAGFSFLTFGILVVFMLPLFALFLWQFQRRRIPHYLLAAAAFFLFSLPWWIQAVPGLLVVYDPNDTTIPPTWSFRLLGVAGLLLPAFFGFREPWAPTIIWPILAPFILIFYLASILYIIPVVRRTDEKAPSIDRLGFLLLGGQVISWAMLYFGTRFSADPTGRYILPLYPALFIVVGLLLERINRWRRIAAIGLLAALLTYNLAGHVRAVQTVPPGIIAQTHPALQFGNEWDEALIDFVIAHGGRGYSHHWISFKMAFLSHEQVILIPYLPYFSDLRWNPRDDRYPPYAAAVATSSKRVYVTHREPNLETYLQNAFAERQITYQIQDIGPYRVYYDFSTLITPQEIGLGKAK